MVLPGTTRCGQPWGSMQRPSIRQLEYAVAVAENLHFGRAAKQCAVTQPALSAQIQQLEELLGVTLFERGRRGVLVTPDGARVLEKAREALAVLDDLVGRASRAGRPLVGEVRLGVIPTVAPYFLPPLLPRVRDAYPELRLVLREEQTDGLVQRLESGSLDAVLLALPVEQARLVEMPLFEESFYFVAPEGHRLARLRGSRIPEAALEDEEVLLLEDGHCLRAQALEVCRRAGARGGGRLQATSLSTLVQMVANGLGVTLLPERALPVEIRPDSKLAVKAFEAPVPSRTIGLAWRRGAPREEELRLLGAALLEAARKEAPPPRPAQRRSQAARVRAKGSR
jgi:LysR family hydrogen peroxide-inducible transcriptional activator